jgi:sugar phosphate isomerase/epimerase
VDETRLVLTTRDAVMIDRRLQPRRTFVKQILGVGGLAAMSRLSVTPLIHAQPARWADRLGLQVYTVRDQLAKDFEGTLAKVAQAGYKEVELFGSLGDRSAKEVRAILDRVGLEASSTHIAVAPGEDLDRQLDDYATIGHRYTAVRIGPARSGPGSAPSGPRPAAPPNTVDRWKRQAEALNQVGLAGKKRGIRALLHNHVIEFEPIGGAGIGYDILLSETDPDLVAMELDIGWASIAGQNALAMFKRHPGRYRLWHVKDTRGLAAVVAKPIQERQGAADFVPIGSGDIDYKTVFAAASTAGLEHFFVEQDNAVQGDSIAAARASAEQLKRLLR